MRSQFSIAFFLVLLMTGLSASSSIQSLTDIENEKFSHTQNVDSNWEWSNVISGSEDIISDDIGIDSQGNTYIVGTITGEPDSKDDLMASNGGMDVYVAKFGPQGNQLWISNAGGQGNDYGTGIVVSEDSSGNTVIFVTGHLQMRETSSSGALIVHTANFGDLLSYTISTGETSPFVAKIDTNGDWQWATIGEGYFLESDSTDIAFDGDNRIYIGGRFSNYLNFTTTGKTGETIVNSAYTGCGVNQKMGYVGVFTTTGEHVNTKTLGGCNTWINALDVRSDSNIFVAGGFWGGATIAGEDFIIESGALGAPHGNGYYFNTNGDVDKDGNLIGSWSPALEETFIAALSPGVLDWSWARHITGMNRDRINDVVVDTNHNAIIGGNFMANVSFVTPQSDCSVNGDDFGTEKCLSLRSTGDYDMFIAKITSSGDWVFADSNAGLAGYAPISATDFLQALAIDDYNNLYIMGSFLNNLYVGMDHLHATPYFPLYFVAKYTTDWQWGCQADRVPGYGSEGFTGWGLSRFGGIVVDDNGIPIISGFFANSVRFDEDYISQNHIGEKVNSAYIAKLSDYCADPNPVPQNIMLDNIYREQIRHLEDFTKDSNELVEDFDFEGKSVLVTVKSYGGNDMDIAPETTGRTHNASHPNKPAGDTNVPGVAILGDMMGMMIIDAGSYISKQALNDATVGVDGFSDYTITLVSVGSEEPNVTENYTSKAEALQALIESGIFPIFESHDDDDESTEGRASRKPIKGYVYIRKTNRGVDTGEPTQTGVVAWGIRDDGSGNGYLVDDLPHSLQDVKSGWNTPLAADEIDDVCQKLLNRMSFLSEEDACVSVFVEELESAVSEDDGTECYIASGPTKKDQFYLGMESRNTTSNDTSTPTSVTIVGDLSKLCPDSTVSNDGPNRGQQNCGFDVALSNVVASTDMSFYEVGDVITATYLANCTVEPLSYTIKATTLRSNGEVVSSQEYSWMAASTTQSFDEVHEKLDADVYCVTAELTESTTSISRVSTSCFVVSSTASGTGGGSSLPGFTFLLGISAVLIAGIIRTNREE